MYIISDMMRQIMTDSENPLQIDAIFSIGEVAKYLGFSTRTVSRWISDGKIGYYRLGGKIRFSAKQVSDFVNSGKQKQRKR